MSEKTLEGLPALPSNVSHVTRRIRACESEVPAQLVLEHAMTAYAESARAPLLARIEVLERDAARYRWLREHSETGIRYRSGEHTRSSYFMLVGKDLDMVIDSAALSSTEGKPA
jgi:hypothetical protein